MILVTERGDLPKASDIYTFRCRNCGTKFSALARDVDRTLCTSTHWHLHIKCPCCHFDTELSVEKPWASFMSLPDKDVEVEQKPYGGTF